MDPVIRYHDYFSRKVRPPVKRPIASNDRKEKSFEIPRKPGNETHHGTFGIYNNSPGRTYFRPLVGRTNSTGIDSGKENRSASSSHRKKKGRTLHFSSMNENPILSDIQQIESKHPDLAQKINIYMNPEHKNKEPAGRPSGSGSKNHRRFNSSIVSGGAKPVGRVNSIEKKDSGYSKNNSFLNNSSIMEEYMNNSKEDLREGEISQLMTNQHSGYVSHAKIDETYGEMGADVMEQIDEHVQASEDNRQNGPQNAAFEKGREYFKERNYAEAIKLFQEALQTSDSLEIQYLLGVAYLWKGEYEMATKYLNTLLEKHGFHHKNIFLLLAMAYKKQNKPNDGIRVLSKAIGKFNKYYEAYIMRGKLYIKEKKWEKGLLDFNFAIQINSNKALGYIGKGDCLRMLSNYDEAINCYSEAMTKEINIMNVGLLKRAIAFIEIKHYEDALDDLQALIANDPYNSEAFYFKGFILEKKKDYNQSILCFEQAIKHNSSKKAVLKSLYEISKIKIESRAFYEAYHTLNRAELLGLDQKLFSKFKLFTEGVIFLMKRKYEEGMESLNSVLKRNISDFIKPLAFNYRAYGFFCQGKIKKALSDYNELQKYNKLDRAASYNKTLCQAILAAEDENFEVSSNLFIKANQIYRNKMEPYFYKAMLAIYQFRKLHPNKERKKLIQCINGTIKDLDKAIELNDGCANLLYIRALIFYILGRFDIAHTSIEKAIDKADENYAKYFYLRGCIASSAQSYQSAINDCTIAINLDKEFSPAYLERGKCYFTLGDIKQAFLDIQKYISIKPDDPNIHLWAGNLLFNTGAHEDAIRAYSNADGTNKNEKLLTLRVKCNIVLKELNAALTDLGRLIELKSNNNVKYYVDRECLISLKVASTIPQGQEYLDPTSLSNGIQRLGKVIGFKVPGEVFSLHDLFMYKSIFHFYAGEFEQAVADIDVAYSLRDKHSKKVQERRRSAGGSQDSIKIMDEFCSDIDENEEEEITKGTFDIKDYLYNKAIYVLMMGDIKSALTQLKQLESLLVPEVKERLDVMTGLLEQDLEFKVKQSLDIKDDTIEPNPEGGSANKEKPGESENSSIDLTVFPSFNRLCSIFPSVRFPVEHTKKIFETKLSFCLPYVEPPSMTPTINDEVIEEINVTSVEYRPEAPWIRRNLGGVIFTENYIDREEKSIDNLEDVIKNTGLKAEDLYEIESQPKEEKEEEEQQSEQNSDLNKAIIMNDEANQYQNMGMEDLNLNEEEDFLNNAKMRRARTGSI